MLKEAQENEILRLAIEVEPSFMVLSSSAKLEYTQLVLEHLFRVRSYKQFVTGVRELGPFDAKALRKNFISNGYLLKNVKAWLYWIVANKVRGAQANREVKNFGIQYEDRALRLCMSPLLIKKLTVLSKTYKVLSVRAIDNALAYANHEMQDWLGKFVYVKLRFIYQTEGLTAEDLKSEVFQKGINSMLLMYPRISNKLHCVNIMKAASRNYGINLAQRAGHDLQSRLVRNSDKTFSSRFLPYDLMTSTIESWLNSGASQVEEARSRDLRIDFEKICTQYSGKRLRLLSILIGVEDPEFEEWLVRKRITKKGSEWLQSQLSIQNYMRVILQFLNVSEAKGFQFIRTLRNQLQEYRI